MPPTSGADAPASVGPTAAPQETEPISADNVNDAASILFSSIMRMQDVTKRNLDEAAKSSQ